jgi:hypothetical protein
VLTLLIERINRCLVDCVASVADHLFPNDAKFLMCSEIVTKLLDVAPIPFRAVSLTSLLSPCGSGVVTRQSVLRDELCDALSTQSDSLGNTLL